MKLRHVKTVDRFLNLEVGYASEIGPAGLYEAIVEALEKAGVLDEANIIYIRARSNESNLEAVDLWQPKEIEVEPPPLPATEPEPQYNI